MFRRFVANLKLLNSKRSENRAFERKIVRDEKNLSISDVKFIKNWSLSGFGIGGAFYMLFRNLYEPLGILAAVGFLSRLIEKRWAYALYNPAELWLKIIIWSLTIIFSFIWVYSIYFLARHGRRLSWNRCYWKSIDEFKKLEKRWFWWNFVGSIVLFIFLS